MRQRMTNDPIAEVSRLFEEGRIPEAYELLNRAEAAGDGRAALTLGDLRLSGQAIRRDLAEAQRRYASAAEMGEPEGVVPAAALLASGPANVTRDWQGALHLLESGSALDPAARAQLDIIRTMPIDADGEPLSLPEPRILNAAPRVAVLDGFLSQQECSFLIALASMHLQPSVVVEPRTGQLIRDPMRTGSTAGFGLVLENPALHAINRRIARASGTAWEQGEPVQVIAYEPGQEYKLHSDALPPGQPQRIKTFLVALNDDYEGGATAFPDLGLELRLKTGDALMFDNVGSDGRPATVMRHAGRPVTRGRKFLLSRWIRERPIDLSGPPGRPF